ncbi:MAG: SDR family oxidoreductase [Gemmatimonadaceae bacterium]
MQSVLVTGVGRAGQLGEAVALAFAARGARVIAVGHSLGEVSERVAALRVAGKEAHAFACDLTDEAQVRALAIDVARVTGGALDALVNLAGGFAMSGRVAESDPAVWNRQFALNLTTAYHATRAMLPMLREARGAVAFVASAAALPGARVAEMSAYAAAKGGVLTLMRAVAAEERGAVRANAVAPTGIDTAANSATAGTGSRLVAREAVADAIVFLCSDEARAITGTVIPLE